MRRVAMSRKPRASSKPRSRVTLADSRARRSSTVEEYLAELSPDNRSALERLRRNIRAAAPRAEECISYGIPAFRLDGRVLVWYGAAAKHCAFYPGGVVGELADELAGWDTSKG